MRNLFLLHWRRRWAYFPGKSLLGTQQVHMISSTNNNTHSLPSTNTNRSYHSATLYRNDTIVTCGGTNSTSALNSCEQLSLREDDYWTGVWQYFPPLPMEVMLDCLLNVDGVVRIQYFYVHCETTRNISSCCLGMLDESSEMQNNATFYSQTFALPQISITRLFVLWLHAQRRQ